MPAGPPPADDDLLRCRRAWQLGPFPFPPGYGVVDAADAHADIDVADAALGAGDTGADILRPAALRLVRPMGVRNEGAGEADDVGAAGGDEILRQAGRVDPAGADDGQGDDGLQARRQMTKGAGRAVVRRPVVAPAPRARHQALPHVEIVDLAAGLEQSGDVAVIVEAQRERLQIVIEADAEQAPGPEFRPNDVEHFVEEGHPLRQRRAAEFVVAPVGFGVEEVGEEVVHAD